MKRTLILFLLLILAACQQQATDERLPLADFRVGSEGLRIQFAPNLPPNRMYETEDLNVVLDIQNLGAADVGGAGDRIYLSGFDPTIITGIPSTGIPIPQIEGKDQFNLIGGFDQVSFKGIIARLQGDQFPTPLMATACYQYETIASESACIDPDPFGPRLESKVCWPQNIVAGSQGAPIAVTYIEVESRPQKTLFRIHVSNVGGGDVFRYGTTQLAKCSPFDSQGLSFEDFDYVQLANVEVGGMSITSSCRPLDDGHIPLRGGQGIVTCEMPVTGASAYVTPITVTLRYGYRSTIIWDIIIYTVT